MSRERLLFHKFAFKFWITFSTVALLFSACHTARRAVPVDYLQPDATKDKPLTVQKKRTIEYRESGVWVSNEFAGGRLNEFHKLNDSTFTAFIRPENAPINNSAWYAFKIWGDAPKTITINLSYADGGHRYHPKISNDRESWQLLDNAFYSQDTAKGSATIRLNIGTDTLWVAGQELFTSENFDRKLADLSKHSYVRRSVLGNSKLGKSIHKLEITESLAPKRYVAIISRQHPPELTGTFALLAFLETICEDTPLAQQFRREFSTIVIPLMNPDGVDGGHWRHNAGGIDLNRDWLYFNQPETRLARDEFLKITRDHTQKLYFFLDFHSTQRDIFYTMDKKLPTDPPGFLDKWLENIHQQLPEYAIRERPSLDSQPVSKNWFYKTFKAPSLTYEVGDDTNRETIRRVGRAAAIAMMEILNAEINQNN